MSTLRYEQLKYLSIKYQATTSVVVTTSKLYRVDVLSAFLAPTLSVRMFFRSQHACFEVHIKLINVKYACRAFITPFGLILHDIVCTLSY